MSDAISSISFRKLRCLAVRVIRARWLLGAVRRFEIVQIVDPMRDKSSEESSQMIIFDVLVSGFVVGKARDAPNALPMGSRQVRTYDRLKSPGAASDGR